LLNLNQTFRLNLIFVYLKEYLMKNVNSKLITLISVWLGYMILVWLHYNLGKWGLMTALLCYTYILIISFALTKFLERESIIERFGFQTRNLIILLIATCSALVFLYYLKVNIFNFSVINFAIIAPLMEEIFYRGYMLGSFCAKADEMNIESLKWILFTSILFSIGHVFILGRKLLPYIYVLIFGFVEGMVYVKTKTISWVYIVHMASNTKFFIF